MERNSINCIIFDQDEPSIKDHRESRTAISTKTANGHKSHHLEIIQTEITYLTDKIKSLEEQADSLTHLKQQNASMCRQSTTTIDIGQQQSMEILMAIEKKIQIVVRQTKKIVDKVCQNFDKKVKAKLTKKADQSGANKSKEQYQQAIKSIEKNYRIQLQEIEQRQREVENAMVAKVNALEQKMSNKIKEMEKKQKEYVDWIHHLERQLQENQEKSKKRIEVTHVKKDVSESSSVLTVENNQYESVNTNKIASQVGNSQFGSQMSNQNQQCNESKIQRRHKIFDPVTNKASSVSPCNKPASPSPIYNAPLTPSNLTGSSKLINPLHKPKQQPQQPESQVQIDKPTLVIEKATEPLKNNFTGNEKELSPWRQMDKSIEKGSTNRQAIIKDANESQFYKDVPRANQGWERFQDFTQNDDSSSDSDEQIIFYRNDEKRQSNWIPENEEKWTKGQRSSGVLSSQRHSSHYEPPIEQKVFSPFDLN